MNKHQSGFTLIELSIVLIISGIMIVVAIEAYTIYDEKRKAEQINMQMADLDQYIKNFPSMINPATVDPTTGIGTPYGRFPCPAPMDGTGAGNDFDTEDCSITPIAGVQPDGSNGGTPVLIGKIPAATLGLHSDYMRDPYGNYLLYAVTQGAANSATYGTTSGAIQVIEEGIDHNPASATLGNIIELERHNNVQYMVASMGDTGAGAYAFNGEQPVACPDNTIKEHENCDGDARFITSLLSERNTNSFYDDKLLFAANTVVVPNNEEPAECEQSETIQLYGDTCPNGWEKITGLDLNKIVATNGGCAGSECAGIFRNERELIYAQVSGVATQYFNIDPQTGDYYFTNFKTPDTVPNLGTPPSPTVGENFLEIQSRVACEKTSQAKSNQKCFNKTVTSNKSIRAASQIPSDYNQLKSACPSGYRPIKTSPHTTTNIRCTGGGNRGADCSTISGMYYSITCGK